jgi:AbrB family looped-hinge helix DNA binding protein
VGTRVTVKRQVTIPKAVRTAAGIKPGDAVEFVVDPAGRVTLQHADRQRRLREALERIQRDPPIKGITADAIMDLTRGKDR